MGEGRQTLAGMGEGFGVAIEADDAGSGLEETLGVAASAEGAVEKENAGGGSQKGDDLVGEDWNVIVHAARCGLRIFQKQVEVVVEVQAVHKHCVV